MTTARAVAERFFERFGVGDLEGAFALFAPDCISLTPTGPLDNEKHHAAAQALKRALPDCSMQLLRVLELGDEVYVTGRFQGTHDGDLATPIGTLAGSGKSLDLLFVNYFRVVDGHIVECEAVRDRLDMILQLGGVPRPQPVTGRSAPRARRQERTTREGLLRSMAGLLVDGGWLSIADLDEDPDGAFHADKVDFDGHDGFDRQRLAEQVARAGFADVSFVDATTILKGDREFGVFLCTATKAHEPGGDH